MYYLPLHFDVFKEKAFLRPKQNSFRLEEPCDGCAAPYGYRHIMPLTTDTRTFAVSLCEKLQIVFFAKVLLKKKRYRDNVKHITYLFCPFPAHNKE